MSIRKSTKNFFTEVLFWIEIHRLKFIDWNSPVSDHSGRTNNNYFWTPVWMQRDDHRWEWRVVTPIRVANFGSPAFRPPQCTASCRASDRSYRLRTTTAIAHSRCGTRRSRPATDLVRWLVADDCGDWTDDWTDDSAERRVQISWMMQSQP